MDTGCQQEKLQEQWVVVRIGERVIGIHNDDYTHTYIYIYIYH